MSDHLCVRWLLEPVSAHVSFCLIYGITCCTLFSLFDVWVNCLSIVVFHVRDSFYDHLLFVVNCCFQFHTKVVCFVFLDSLSELCVFGIFGPIVCTFSCPLILTSMLSSIIPQNTYSHKWFRCHDIRLHRKYYFKIMKQLSCNGRETVGSWRNEALPDLH